MKGVLLFCVAVLAVAVCAVHGFTVRERFTEVIADVAAIADFDTYVAAIEDLTQSNGCYCHRSSCYCHGQEDHLKIEVMFTVDEFRGRICKQTIIDAKFSIGHDIFVKQFLANRFEDFCHTVGNERFCFRIDIHDTSTGGLLRGCVRLSRPRRLEFGCFMLPLMTSECEEVLSEENDSNDVLLNSAESAETVDGTTDNMMDVSLTGMSEYRDVAEMQVPAESDYMKKISDCVCNNYACQCEGNDDGYIVSVIFIVNEVRHGDHNHTRIQARFRVDTSTFYRTFSVAKFDYFCKTVDGKEFCFDIDVSNVCGAKIQGCISLAKPKRIRLGCFNIPL